MQHLRTIGDLTISRDMQAGYWGSIVVRCGTVHMARFQDERSATTYAIRNCYGGEK